MAFQDILRSILPMAGGAIGGLAGGPAGAAAGSALGTFGGSYLGRRNQSQRYMNPRQQLGNGGFPSQQMGDNQNMMSQELTGGTTAVQTPRFNQQQQGMLAQLLSQGFGGMQNLPQADFAPIEKEATSQFYQNTVPGIAEQFSGAGAGSQRSSAFEQALGGAGAGLQERLASMKQGFNMQNRGQEINRLMSMLQMGGQQQFENAFIPPGQGFGTSIAGGLSQGVGMASPFMMQMLMNAFKS